MLQDITNHARTYYGQIPSDTIGKITDSALISYSLNAVFPIAATLIWGGGSPIGSFNLARPLYAAGVAALSSLIYAMTVPLFSYLFEEKKMFPHWEMIKQVIVMTLSSLLVHSFTSSKINLYAVPLIRSVSVNLLKGTLELIPICSEEVFGDEDFAEKTRNLFEDWGLSGRPGSSSLFFAWC